MADPSKPLGNLASISKALDIPGFLKIDFSFNFGKNGFIGFPTSPKEIIFLAQYRNQTLAEFRVITVLGEIGKASQSSKDVMMSMFTEAQMEVPVFSPKKADFEMKTSLFKDFSSSSEFNWTIMDGSNSRSESERQNSGIIFFPLLNLYKILNIFRKKKFLQKNACGNKLAKIVMSI